jgi:hypothetical protein
MSKKHSFVGWVYKFTLIHLEQLSDLSNFINFCSDILHFAIDIKLYLSCPVIIGMFA